MGRISSATVSIPVPESTAEAPVTTRSSTAPAREAVRSSGSLGATRLARISLAWVTTCLP